MEFSTSECTDSLARVAIAGRLDVVRAAALEVELNRLSARRVPVVMDLSGVEFLASLVIGQFAVFIRGLANWGCPVVLLSPAPVIEKSLRTTGMDRIAPIVHDEAAALALAVRRG